MCFFFFILFKSSPGAVLIVTMTVAIIAFIEWLIDKLLTKRILVAFVRILSVIRQAFFFLYFRSLQ